jgi:hypothetical protein
MSVLNNRATKCRSADQIIGQWREDRRDTIRQCNLNGVATDIFPHATTCILAELPGTQTFHLHGVCLGCTITRQLFPDALIQVDQELPIVTGAHIGMKLQVTRIPKARFRGYQPNLMLAHRSQQLLDRMALMDVCEPNFRQHLAETQFYSCQGNYLEHQVMVSSIIEYELTKESIPTLPDFRWLWHCVDHTYVVTEKLLPFSAIVAQSRPLAEPLLMGILGQLFATLDFLTDYTFTHGNPSLHSLKFSNRVTFFEYKGVKIASPMILHLIPAGSSAISLMVDGVTIRLTHTDNLTPHLIPPVIPIYTHVNPEQPSSSTGCHVGTPEHPIPQLTELSTRKFVTYRLGAEFLPFRQLVQQGVPIFAKSFDLYALLFALLCEVKFYEGIMSSPKLRPLIASLFLPEEFAAVLACAKEQWALPPASSATLAQLLANFHLRCDAQHYAWRQFSVM